jgi:hypothetical protein
MAPDAADVEIDQAIADWLREETDSAGRRLVALGQAALLRAVEIYYGGSVCQVVAEVYGSRHARELVDAWAVALATLAQAYPEVYLAEINAGRIPMSAAEPTTEVSILGGIDLPAAATLLCKHRTHPDWLVRYHVVRGLGRRTDRASVEAVEQAVTDPERMIRNEAARWVQRRDPDAARVLYQRLLNDPGLPPGLRPELVRRLGTAKRLATVRQRSLTADDPETNLHR